MDNQLTKYKNIMKENKEAVVLTLKRKQKDVPMESQDGSVVVYTLRELTGRQRDEYHQATAKRMKYDAKGSPAGVKDFVGMQADLITLCLYDPQGRLVTPEDVSGWPATTQAALFDMAQEINGLEVDEETLEKLKKA